VHDFLARVVSDPQAQAAFAADPAAALEEAGLGDLDTEQLGYACSLAVDYAPADVVEAYRSALASGLADHGAPGRNVSINSATNSSEIASMNMHKPHHDHGHHFGHDGDVDKFMAKDSFNLINIHDNFSHNSFGAPPAPAPGHDGAPGQLQGALTHGSQQLQGALSHGPEQLQGALAHGPEQLQGALAQGPEQLQGALAHGPEQLQGALAHGPEQLQGALAHGPEQVQGALAHGPEQLHAAAGSLPVVGHVADQLPTHLPSPEEATSHLSSLPAHGSAALGAPVEGLADNVPGLGEAAGHLPLDGLHG
jgi:hypothetical protein